MSTGSGHVIVGIARVTVIETFAPPVAYVVVSAGVNVTDSGCKVPIGSTVPAAGEYTKVPGTFAVAFCCAAPSVVPNVIGAGFDHVIVGVSLLPDVVTVMPDDMVWRPAASRARAVSTCEPLVAVDVSQLIAYGCAVTSGPNSAPSSRNCTPTTAISSDASAAATTIPLTVCPFAGAVIDTAGAVASTLTVRVFAKPVAALESRPTADR